LHQYDVKKKESKIKEPEEDEKKKEKISLEMLS